MADWRPSHLILQISPVRERSFNIERTQIEFSIEEYACHV